MRPISRILPPVSSFPPLRRSTQKAANREPQSETRASQILPLPCLASLDDSISMSVRRPVPPQEERMAVSSGGLQSRSMKISVFHIIQDDHSQLLKSGEGCVAALWTMCARPRGIDGMKRVNLSGNARDSGAAATRRAKEFAHAGEQAKDEGSSSSDRYGFPPV